MNFVYKFAIMVSWTDNQREDIVKAYPTNIFLADLANNIAWVIVKMIDNQELWVVKYVVAGLGESDSNGGNVTSDSKTGRKCDTKFTQKGKLEVGGDGWNEEGKALYRIRGCLKAIDQKHWEEDWQRYWGAHPDNTLVKNSANYVIGKVQSMQPQIQISQFIPKTPPFFTKV